MEYYLNSSSNPDQRVTYSVSYNELKEEYEKILLYSDTQFLENIVEVLHTTCIIAYFKELPNICLVSDEGIIHLLIHLLGNVSGSAPSHNEIRNIKNPKTPDTALGKKVIIDEDVKNLDFSKEESKSLISGLIQEGN